MNRLQHQEATSCGLRYWHSLHPKCKECKTVRLVRHDRREKGICYECEKKINKLSKKGLTNKSK